MIKSMDQSVVESIEGEGKELQLLQEIAMNSSRMAESCEAMLEMGRVMIENLEMQFKAQREFQRNDYSSDNVRQGRMNNEPTQPRQQVICYRCQRPGHIRMFCGTRLGPLGNQFREIENQNYFTRQPAPLTRAPSYPHGPRGNRVGWRPQNVGGGDRRSMEIRPYRN